MLPVQNLCVFLRHMAIPNSPSIYLHGMLWHEVLYDDNKHPIPRRQVIWLWENCPNRTMIEIRCSTTGSTTRSSFFTGVFQLEQQLAVFQPTIGFGAVQICEHLLHTCCGCACFKGSISSWLRGSSTNWSKGAGERGHMCARARCKFRGLHQQGAVHQSKPRVTLLAGRGARVNL